MATSYLLNFYSKERLKVLDNSSKKNENARINKLSGNHISTEWKIPDQLQPENNHWLKHILSYNNYKYMKPCYKQTMTNRFCLKIIGKLNTQSQSLLGDNISQHNQ
uniref:Uncharacterized protein n=1 Tax=Homalodisca liturata TaxID=320908 RepID=A0A1B6IAJ9_9HEMI